MWQVINELITSHKSGRSSVKELSPNGVSVTNNQSQKLHSELNYSTTLSNTFDDHFSTIDPKLACEIPLNNGPSFQEFKYTLAFKVKDSKFIPTDSNQVFSYRNVLHKMCTNSNIEVYITLYTLCTFMKYTFCSCLFLRNSINLKMLVQMKYLVSSYYFNYI